MLAGESRFLKIPNNSHLEKKRKIIAGKGLSVTALLVVVYTESVLGGVALSTRSKMPFNVVALVSGGKDSTMNMMKCVAHGHKIVALANIFPAAEEGDELDSFMYQTVGHDAITSISQCMELPMFRRPILRGRSLLTEIEYQKTEGDEVEDLFLLLKFIKAKMPHVDAVASGAILSNYQRTRVEAVCMRLGMTSLSFLWRRDQKELLDEMIDSELNAVIVKVACMGLKPSLLPSPLYIV